MNDPEVRIEVCRDRLTGGIQLAIWKTDEEGHGEGFRILGPKYVGQSTLLVQKHLSACDAREIASYLDALLAYEEQKADQ